MGDFNYDTSKYPHTKVQAIENSYLLSQIIDNPTRVTPSTKSIIDHIYISDHLSPISSGVLSICISDHYPVFVILPSISVMPTNPQLHKTVTRRSYKHFVYENFIRDLLHSPKLVSLYNIRDVSLAWNTFKQEFLHIPDVHAPIQSQHVKIKANYWVNNSIIEMIYKRNHLHKVAILTKSTEDLEKYKKLRNEITLNIRKSKHAYYENEINTASNDPTKLWNILKQILPSKKSCTKSCSISPQEFNDFLAPLAKSLLPTLVN